MPAIKMFQPESAIFLIDLVLHIWLVLRVWIKCYLMVMTQNSVCADTLQIQMRINRIIAETTVQSMCAFETYLDLQLPIIILVVTLQNPTLQ